MTGETPARLNARWLKQALVTVDQMRAADMLAATRLGGGFPLMQAAGRAVAEAAREACPSADGFDILCGPGNNGGDGYVAASRLLEAGLDVTVWKLVDASGGDAREAASRFSGRSHPLADFTPRAGRIVVDALFGAGLSRPLDGAALEAWRKVEKAGGIVVAVDLPSGLRGDTGEPPGEAFRAQLTVTFARRKPAHLLHPARRFCGRIVLADIGISDETIAVAAPRAFANDPGLWRDFIPWPEDDTHKYRRGHLAVFSGPAAATGAARLSAAGGARAGAGAVTLLSPSEALAENAAHLTAVMLRPVDSADELEAVLAKAQVRAAVLGPGFGDLEKARAFVLALLRRPPDRDGRALSLVLDADGITAFRDDPAALYEAATGKDPRVVLTPHMGEFGRLFPDLAENEDLSKIEMARQAASRAGAVIVLKGPDTLIAEPSGLAVVNTNATPFLATAGSGDVLSGLCGGLLAGGMPAFEAACAGVWIHAEAARRFGPGLTADDLPDATLSVWRDLAPLDSWDSGGAQASPI